MIHKELRLQLDDQEIKRLKELYGKVIKHLEDGFPLELKVLEELKTALSGIVNGSAGWREVLAGRRMSGNFYCLHLLHEDSDILNMPWSMAVDDASNKALGQVEHLVLSKCKTSFFKKDIAPFRPLPSPLKVLIMISSPVDADWKSRLSYEQEETEILNAFEPLMQSGLVIIDFCEDGSLETMKQKLEANRYHVLHFSGHARFSEEHNTGTLELEDPVTLKTHHVTAQDFADGVNCNTGHRVPLVVLSSCQTAKGGSEKGLEGITEQLLRAGIPAAVSMGMSVSDRYAALFTARMYRRMAEKQPVSKAFGEAVRYIGDREYRDRVKANIQPPTSLQWLIPHLYLSQEVAGVVDWQVPAETLHFSANRYIFEKNRLLLEHEENYLFIGRREDKAKILRPLLRKRPILLKGLGGVGKTALAEHLVQRLIAANPAAALFVFDEKIKSVDEILGRMEKFLMLELRAGVTAELNKYDRAMEKLVYLLSEVMKKHAPIFVFDNLETFQAGPGENFSEAYSGIREIIEFLCQSGGGRFHIILTCRYPVPDIKDLEIFDLNQVGLNDFRKKCLYLDVGHIYRYLREAAAGRPGPGELPGRIMEFSAIVRLLHRVFGGNYRALEFFNRLLKENPGTIKDSLESLESFLEKTRDMADRVREEMGRDLLFAQLMALLELRLREVLALLVNFRVPVQLLALTMQMQNKEQKKELDPPTDFINHEGHEGHEGDKTGKTPHSEREAELLTLLGGLHRLTLLEITVDPEFGLRYYYVTPIVKDLLATYEESPGDADTGAGFSHKQAGSYYYYAYHNTGGGLTALGEGFYHFDRAGEKDKAEEIGAQLSGYYYKYYMYHNAFFYARRVYELKGGETAGVILNRLGIIYKVYGDYEKSLEFFEKALAASQKEGDKKNEGTTLNNISGIYSARGDYDTALKYLEKDLSICRELGDRSGSIPTLHNMAMIAYEKGDNEKFMEYDMEAYRLALETGDASYIYRVGWDLGYILYQSGGKELKEQAAAMLKKSLDIGKAAGFPDVAKLEEDLKNLR